MYTRCVFRVLFIYWITRRKIIFFLYNNNNKHSELITIELRYIVISLQRYPLSHVQIIFNSFHWIEQFGDIHWFIDMDCMNFLYSLGQTIGKQFFDVALLSFFNIENNNRNLLKLRFRRETCNFSSFYFTFISLLNPLQSSTVSRARSLHSNFMYFNFLFSPFFSRSFFSFVPPTTIYGHD